MNLNNLLPILIKSIPVSFAIYIFVCNVIKRELKPDNVIKYLLITTIPSLLMLVYPNFYLYGISKTAAIVIGLKLTLNVSFKKVIIPIAVSLCFYDFLLNVHSTAFGSYGILNVILQQKYLYLGIYGFFIPSLVIAASFAFKRYLGNYFFLDNIHLLDNKLYAFVAAFLLFIKSLSAYFSPYYTAISGDIGISKFQSAAAVINVFFFTTLIFFYISIKNYFGKMLTENQNMTLIENTENIKNLNKELRSQKHDFFNHLQVISGLLQLKKYSECFEYVVNLNNSGSNSNSVRTGLIAVNALLNAKQLRAKHKNIKLDFDISSQLDEANFKIADWEITRVLGNLIDNAIYEESKVSTLDKYVKVKIDENKHHYSFSVYNKNSYIGKDKKRSIFSSGFSTKGNDGHGMGLYIVKNIVEKHEGKIDLDSDIGLGTKFSICIPKHNEIPQNTCEDSKSYPPQESLSTQIV